LIKKYNAFPDDGRMIKHILNGSPPVERIGNKYVILFLLRAEIAFIHKYYLF